MDSLSFSDRIQSHRALSSTHYGKLQNQAFAVASISIFLYGSMFIISMYYFIKFINHEKDNVRAAYTNIGKYDHAKKLFFGLLAVSSLLEIPNYIGCLAGNGITDCEWKTADHLLFWFFHLLALCGYAYCVIIPCLLWSDMINKKDGKLFFSSYKYDNIKHFFRFFLILYLINTCIDIIVSIIYYRNSDGFAYREAPTYSICVLIECIIIVFIAIGCLYCGIQLERYVYNTTFALIPIHIERKFLLSLNLILLVIVLSYLGRAILILRFVPGMPRNFQNPVNYAIYTFIARWIPHILCQGLLILIMRYSGKEIVARNSSLSYHPLNNNNNNLPGSHQEISDEYHPGSNEIAEMEESLLAVYKFADILGRKETTNSGSYNLDNNGDKRSEDSKPMELRSTIGSWIDDVASSVRSSDVTRSDGSFTDFNHPERPK
eukprot:gene4370-4684_t